MNEETKAQIRYLLTQSIKCLAFAFLMLAKSRFDLANTCLEYAGELGAMAVRKANKEEKADAIVLQ